MFELGPFILFELGLFFVFKLGLFFTFFFAIYLDLLLEGLILVFLYKSLEEMYFLFFMILCFLDTYTDLVFFFELDFIVFGVY